MFWGGVLISLGNIALALPADRTVFYLGLILIGLGTGLLKPNCSCLVGELYRGQSGSRRDAAFSIYYVGIIWARCWRRLSPAPSVRPSATAGDFCQPASP